MHTTVTAINLPIYHAFQIFETVKALTRSKDETPNITTLLVFFYWREDKIGVVMYQTMNTGAMFSALIRFFVTGCVLAVYRDGVGRVSATSKWRHIRWEWNEWALWFVSTERMDVILT
jgi:hypothetical protein